MAGGAGERFWPLSRGSHPKQLLNLAAPDKSLLGEAVERLLPMFAPAEIFIATSRPLMESIRAAGLGIPDGNVLGEPCKRNTAGCLAYAAAAVAARLRTAPEKTVMAVLTADHRIAPAGAFRQTVRLAMDAAAAHPALVTIGIPPTRPETGYGYIRAAEPVAGGPAGVLNVAAFHEKPDLPAALEFLAAGGYYWNSGMFFWRLSSFLGELTAANPALAACIGAMRTALERDDQTAADACFAGIESNSIDRALMEKARRVMLVPAAGFEWDDIGAWDALERTLPRDPAGNVTIGTPVLVEASDCIVYNVAGAEKMAVGVIGASNLVVVVAPDAVLVMPKERAQDVRAVVAELKRRNAGQV